ncbi:MAG: PHP domain-containing protein [Streptomycetaceae bacterium]|jgi:predicted metal-dependent phosphoesterase TrpH|nr:MAG: PHP domain-containing protein [Streptomycetaceae bacterium]
MIDLHTHTNRSDGTDSPRELINKAISLGMSVIGVTDHDTTSGWAEATESLRGTLGLALGSEISCLTEDGISVHMLGLLFDGGHTEMQIMLEETRDGRLPRMRKMIEKMRQTGIDIAMEDVYEALPEGATLGRPHLADALVNKGIIKSRDEAFQGMLNNDSQFYVSHAAPTPEVAIGIIRSAGGVAVIAHPFASLRGKILQTSDFKSLVDAGLNGIEVDHRDQNPDERAMLREIALDLDLVITGASDYHGSGKLNSLGEYGTSPDQWERLEAQSNSRRVVRA